ncbi:MAG: hypothetical protein V4608_07455 [Bacteroidota bacterium]
MEEKEINNTIIGDLSKRAQEVLEGNEIVDFFQRMFIQVGM